MFDLAWFKLPLNMEAYDIYLSFPSHVWLFAAFQVKAFSRSLESFRTAVVVGGTNIAEQVQRTHFLQMSCTINFTYETMIRVGSKDHMNLLKIAWKNMIEIFFL